MNGPWIAPQIDVGCSACWFFLFTLTRNKEDFGKVGVFGEIRALRVLTRYDCLQVIAFGY